MTAELLPAQIDNAYKGHVAGLWVFGAVVAMRMLQSFIVMFNGASVVRSADGVPIETFPADASRAVVSLFAHTGLHRLFLLLVCVVVLARYRSAVPAMYVLLMAHSLAGMLLLWLLPLASVGRPVGMYVNFAFFILLVVGLALSLRTAA